MTSEHLSRKVGAILRRNKMTVAVAESCTGGLLGAALTSVAGSSDYFAGGVISYSNEVKARQLGVKTATLKKYGAVSCQTALEMARGVRRQMGVDVGLGITGIAGPGGGTSKKPVGLVYISVAGPGKETAIEMRLSGGRKKIRENACTCALKLLYTFIRSKK